MAAVGSDPTAIGHVTGQATYGVQWLDFSLRNHSVGHPGLGYGWPSAA